MICDCGRRGEESHRVWCALRLEEMQAAEMHAIKTAVLFYGSAIVGLLFFAFRSEIAGWWLAWRTAIGWGLVYGLPVAGLCWIAYRRLR